MIGDVELSFNASSIWSVPIQSNEFCLSEEGNRIYSHCYQVEGNSFEWYIPSGQSCKEILYGNDTAQIALTMKVRESADLENITRRHEQLNDIIIDKFYEFTLVDVYIIVHSISVARSYFEYNDSEMQFLSNVMDIPENILKDSYTNWTALFRQTFTYSSFVSEQFQSKNIVAFSVVKNATIAYKHRNYTIPPGSIQSALQDEPEFVVTFEDHTNDIVTLLVFYNDVLFREKSDRKIIVPIIGLRQSYRFLRRANKAEQVIDLTILYSRSHYLASGLENTSCSVWNEHSKMWQTRSEWSTYGTNNNYYVCNHKTSLLNDFFGVMRTGPYHHDTLYEELEELLQSEDGEVLNSNLTIFVLENMDILEQHHVAIIATILDKPQVTPATSVYAINSLLDAPKDALIDNANNILRALDRKLENNAKLLERIVTDNIVVDHISIGEINGGQSRILGEDVCGMAFQTNAERIYLRCSQTIDDIMIEEKIILAVQFTQKLMDLIKQTSAAKIIINLFLKESLFNDPRTWLADGAKTIGILIPDFKKQFSEPFYLLFRRSYFQAEASCSSWNFEAGWSLEDGSTVTSASLACSDYYICEFKHITHFGMVITDNVKFNDTMEVVLEVLTGLCSFLSLCGLFVIFLTAILYRQWFSQSNSKILLNLSVTVGLQLVLFYIATLHKVGNTDCGSCIALGGILHYVILSGFCWMLVLSYLNYRTYVVVLLGSTPNHLVLKATAFAWLVPLVPVVSLVLADRESYVRNGNLALCYPSGLGFYSGIIFPLCLVLVPNLVICTIIVRSLYYKTATVTSTHNPNLARQKMKLMIVLFFNLGFTWIFGLFAAVFRMPFFAVLFCVTASLQGFILFLFFIPFNNDVRSFYLRRFRAKISFPSSTRTT